MTENDLKEHDQAILDIHLAKYWLKCPACRSRGLDDMRGGVFHCMTCDSQIFISKKAFNMRREDKND